MLTYKMWILKLVLFCCLVIAILATSSDTKSSKKSSSDPRGKRNLEHSLSYPYSGQGYRAERRISSSHRSSNFFPAHKHYITFRRGRPSAPSPPPYAVQMEPLVHYSQRDPLYDGGNLPLSTGNDLTSDYQHVHPQAHPYGVLQHATPPPKIIEKPIYIKEPEPIIEIIIKESNVTLPPAPVPEIVTQPPKKKEPVHVFYVKYQKNPNGGYGKDSIIYEKPIPAISPPVEDEEHQQEEAPQAPLYPPPVTQAPQTPSTTLRAIIKPESDYSGNKHIHIRFGKQNNDQYKRASNIKNGDDEREESAPEPVISQPQSRKFIFSQPPPSFRPPPNFPPKILSRPPPNYRPEGHRFGPPPPPSYRNYHQQLPSFKPPSFPPNQFSQPLSRPPFSSPPILLDRPPSDRPFSNRPPAERPFPNRPLVVDRPFIDGPPNDRPFGDRPSGPPHYQQLPVHQPIPFRQPVPYKPFENFVPGDSSNQAAHPPSFSPTQSQPQRPVSNFDHSSNQPPQSFSNFRAHFSEQQQLPHLQKNHVFHTSQPQNPPEHQYNQQQRLPEQKPTQFNSQPVQNQPLEEHKHPSDPNQPQAQPLIGTFGGNFDNLQYNQQENAPPQDYQHQQFRHQQDQNLLYRNQLPRLPQHQQLPSSQRVNNFNAFPQHQQQQTLSNQQPHHHEEVIPPGGQLIPSVSKFEQHITVPSETKQEQTVYQPNVQNQEYISQLQQNEEDRSVRNFAQLQNQQSQQQFLQNHQQSEQQFLQNHQQSEQQYVQSSQQVNYKPKPSENNVRSSAIASDLSSKNSQLNQAFTYTPHRYSSTTQRTIYQSTTTAPTTTTKNPEKEEKAKKNILDLPDEVPEDLRQQLLSSGILENAQISVLDYDKVGDIPLSALPPDQLSQFFGAGGKEAISSGSEPIPSVIRKNDNPIEQVERDLEPEGSEKLEANVSPPSEVKQQEQPVAGEKYTRYLPIKVNGAQFPIPDLPELKRNNLTSVVVLAPVEYSNSNGKAVKDEVSKERLEAGLALKNVLKSPTKDNFLKWLDVENRTSVDKQSVVLLVTKPEDEKETEAKEIFMYDLSSKSVSRLNGELSTAFVEAAEANTGDNLESVAPSNRVETRVPYPDVDRHDVGVSENEEIEYDLSDAASELVESRIPIIDPMEEKDDYEVEASEQLEQFVDISGLKVRSEDLAAAASDNVENKVIVSSGYSKTGSNKMPSTS